MPGIAVRGHVDAEFESVKAAFEQNFVRERELGASLCVVYRGRPVVDLWGGFADRDRQRPWERDTIVTVFSCTKAAVAVCAHVLATAGELDLDAPIRNYWPEFGVEGKQTLPTRLVLNHQAGLPGIAAELPPWGICDIGDMAERIATERPMWTPGSRHGYHPVTFGWILGELVRRITSESVGTFFRRVIAEPLGTDFWIGLPPTEHHRVAQTTMGKGAGDRLDSPFGEAVRAGCPIQTAVMNSYGELRDPEVVNLPHMLASEIPAVNGISNARGLATLFAPLAGDGQANGVRLVSPAQLEAMATVESASAADAVEFEPVRFSPGFQKAPYASGRGVWFPESAFGHSGKGRSVVFADPAEDLSFGYAMNLHLEDRAAIARAQGLIDATYKSIGRVEPGVARTERAQPAGHSILN